MGPMNLFAGQELETKQTWGHGGGEGKGGQVERVALTYTPYHE